MKNHSNRFDRARPATCLKIKRSGKPGQVQVPRQGGPC